MHLKLTPAVCAVLVGGALPMLVALVPAHAAATCARGSGPHLAGQRITAAEIGRYQGTTGLQCADLARANLSGLNLVQVDLTRANLRRANLSHTRLDQATLTGAAMQGADLRKADLTQATMTRVNLTGADLRRATLDQATLTNADLASADLADASLIEVEAKHANFRSANLSHTTFTGATLTGAHFTGAKLAGAQFTGATGAPATVSRSAGDPSGSGNPISFTSPTVSKGTWKKYLLGAVALIFVLMVLGSVRRFVSLRSVGSFGGQPGFGYQGGYAGPGPGGFGGPAGFGGYGGDASGVGGGFTQPNPGSPYGTVPGYMNTPSQFAGRMSQRRPGRLAVAIVGALVVAIGLWLIGNGVLNTVLVPTGNAGYRLCQTTCGSRIGADMSSLVVGVIVFVVGGILRVIGRIRY